MTYSKEEIEKIRKDKSEFFTNLRKGELEKVQQSIKSRLVDVNNSKTEKGLSALMSAVYCHHPELVEYLLSVGADITMRIPPLISFIVPSTENCPSRGHENALEVAILVKDESIINKLIVHSVIKLKAEEQANLLRYQGHKNVLLYTAYNYPVMMNDLAYAIKEHSNQTKILSDFILSSRNREDNKEINRFLTKFFNSKKQVESLGYLNSMEFDNSLNYFKTLSRSTTTTTDCEMASDFIKELAEAKVTYILTGNKKEFHDKIVEAVDGTLPLAAEQPVWKLAIACFLELLNNIFRINENHIQFFKKSETVQKLEALKIKFENLLGNVPEVF